MSKIVKKVDAQAAAVINLMNDGRGREGSSLMAPEDLEDHLNDVLKWMRGNQAIPGGITVPRFGLLTLILQQTPIFVYGHPALKKISKTAFTDGIHIFISDDLYDRLNEDVVANPGDYGVEWAILHEVMHKLFKHTQRLKHFPPDIANLAEDYSINTKLVEGFPDITPCRSLKELAVGFKPGDKERFLHLSEETIAMELMRERGLQKKRKVEQPPQQGQDQKQQQKGQSGQQPQDQGGQGQPGQGQPGQGGQGGQKPGQNGQGGQQPGQNGQGGKGDQQQGPENDPLSNLDGGAQGGQDPSQGGQGGQDPSQGGGQRGQGQPQGGNQKGGQPGDEDMDGGQGQGGGQGNEEGQSDDPAENFGEEGDIHTIDPAEFARVLEEAGLDGVREKLGIPSSDDLEAIGEMQESARLRQDEAVMQAKADKMKYGDKYPGGHIVDAASEMINNFGKPKIRWTLQAQDLVLGYSPKSAPTMDEPNELRYVPEMMDVLGMEPYMSSIIPHTSEEAVLFLVDTSGSMSQQAMRVALTEAIELKTAAHNMGDAAAEVIIWPCDTMLRGRPIEITDKNVEEFITGGIEMKGRGGTSIDTCINQALASPLLGDKKIKAIIYCSDLYDNPVPKPAALEEHPEIRVLFLCDPETSPAAVEKFAKGTDWADTAVIEDNLDVDFEQINNGQGPVSPTNRRKPKMR